MSEQVKALKRTFSHADLMAMNPKDLLALVGRADAVIQGTAVVRKADGTIRYSPDAKPGDFGESAEDLARVGALEA